MEINFELSEALLDGDVTPQSQKCGQKVTGIVYVRFLPMTATYVYVFTRGNAHYHYWVSTAKAGIHQKETVPVTCYVQETDVTS